MTVYFAEDGHRFDPHQQRLAFYGRCRSGKRWFWSVSVWGKGSNYDEDAERHGWENDEASAIAAARQALVEISTTRDIHAVFTQGRTYERLKEINAAKRLAKPSNSSDAHAVEYLYEVGGSQLVRYRITRIRKKRIFYLKDFEYLDDNGVPTGKWDWHAEQWGPENKVGFVARVRVDLAEPNDRYFQYFTSLPAALAYRAAQRRLYGASTGPAVDLKALKAKMAAAHPDHGGTSAAFIAARREYVAARRAMRP
jgi:hypothetical protein